jgi:hypothetical protein
VRRLVTAAAGAITLVAVVSLFVWHLSPARFPRHAHDVLASVPLVAMVAALMLDHLARRARPGELLRAGLLAVGFLLWATTQLLPELPQGLLLNDLAIALFALDLFLGLRMANRSI